MLIDTSEVQLELGLSGTITDTERAIITQAIKRANGAIVRHLRYNPEQATHTEYYPQQQYGTRYGEGVWEATATEATFRRLSEAATDELYLRNIPVRSITSLYLDYDGRSGSQATSFAAGSLKTEGTDFWANYDVVDAAGNKICMDGILRSIGMWPTEPGTIKITYVAGYTEKELRGDGGSIDASALSEACLDEAVRRARKAFLMAKNSRIGFVAGPVTSETLGEYSYSLDSSLISKMFSDSELTAGTIQKLEAFINWGWSIAS